MAQFRGYTSNTLETLENAVRTLANRKLEEIRSTRDRKIAACTTPQKSLVFLGVAEGTCGLSSGYFCGAFALNATTPLICCASGGAGILSIYLLGKYCIATLNASRPKVINARTRAEAQSDLNFLKQARDSLCGEIGKLKGEMIEVERLADIAALNDANGNTRRVQRQTQQSEIRTLRQRYGAARRDLQRLERIKKGVELQLGSANGTLTQQCQDLRKEIADHKQRQKQDADQMNRKLGKVCEDNEATLGQLRQENRANADALAQLRSENAANLENADRANRAAQRAEAVADELRSTFAAALASIQRAHRENFSTFLRTLESNPSERTVRRLHREGLRRIHSHQGISSRPWQTGNGNFQEENTQAGRVTREDVADGWETLSQQSHQTGSSSSGRSYRPNPQNWAADIRMEMSEQLSRSVDFLN